MNLFNVTKIKIWFYNSMHLQQDGQPQKIKNYEVIHQDHDIFLKEIILYGLVHL